jgi:hypothetical protein
MEIEARFHMSSNIAQIVIGWLAKPQVITGQKSSGKCGTSSHLWWQGGD